MSERRKPSFIKPESRKKQSFASRKQFIEVLRTKNTITIEELTKLKNKRNILEQQRRELVAKVGRYNNLKVHKPTDSQNRQIANSVEEQIISYRDLIAERKRQIEEIRNSDLTSNIIEIQEETKVLHLELVRLKDIKERNTSELSSAEEKYKKFQILYSPRRLFLQERSLQDLRDTVTKKEKAVITLEHPEKAYESYRIQMEHDKEEAEKRNEIRFSC